MTHPKSKLTLDNCDKEPIHIPGVIQSFGGLLAAPVSLTDVCYASANLDRILDRDMDAIIGQSVNDFLPDAIIHEARNVLSYSTSSTQRERVGAFNAAGREMELYVHQNPDRLAILEFEDVPPSPNRKRSPIDTARLFLAKASEARTVDALLQIGAVGLRELTGYDRVKAYRYASDGSGEAVAESRTPDAPSFLGLRYPAWDVPAQARALQIKNPVRVLWGVQDTPIPIL